MKHTNLHFDAIRGLAAILVVAGHVRAVALPDWGTSDVSNLQAPFYVVTGLGDQAVVVFFVLSGYLVGGTVWRNRLRFSAGAYLLNRGTRILIVAWPAVMLGLIAWLYLRGAAVSIPDVGALVTGSPEDDAWLVALANLAFLQPALVPAIATNGPLWSLGYEVQFYVLFPLIIVSLSRATRTRPLLALGPLVLASLLMIFVVGWPGLLYFGVWVLGVVLVAVPIQRRVPVRLAYLALGAVAIAASLQPSPVAGVVVVAIAGAVAIHATGNAESTLTEVSLAFRGLRWLGIRSYSIYAYHFPLIVVSAGLFESHGKGYGGFALISSVAIGGALALYQCTEAHTDEVRRRLRRGGAR